MLRDYQIACKEAVVDAWQEHDAVLVVLATGLGKTFTAASIIADSKGRTLWLAHRGELLDQAEATFTERTGLRCNVEKAERKAAYSLDTWGAAPVVLGSVQTLRGDRLWNWPRNAFQTIVVDEAHRAPAKTYRDILNHFEGAKVLGLTATPDRADGMGLRNVFQTCAYEYNIRDAIHDGWLSPVHQKRVFVDDLDISQVRSVAGDLNQRDLESCLTGNEVLHQIAKPLSELAGQRQTLVFTVTVAQAHALADVLANYVSPDAIRAIDGTTPADYRAAHLEDFQAGNVQFLLNHAVLTEGYDAPETSCIAIARPTQSRALFTQMIGRGTRLADGKENCLVLDFVGNSGRHRLVTVHDALAGEMLADEVLQDAIDCSDGKPDLDALAEAEARAAQRELAEMERRRKAAKLRAEVGYRVESIDAFGKVYPKRNDYGPPAEPWLLRELSRLGIKPKRLSGLCHYDGLAMLRHERSVKKAGGPSSAMREQLAKRGLRTDVSKAEASKIMTWLAERGWPYKLPPWMIDRFGDQV